MSKSAMHDLISAVRTTPVAVSCVTVDSTAKDRVHTVTLPSSPTIRMC